MQVDHKQLKAALAGHFRKRLDELKAKVDANGPLPANELELFKATIDYRGMELEDGVVSPQQHDETSRQLLAKLGIDLSTDSPLYAAFKRAWMQAQRDCLKAAIDYSDSAEIFDFQTGAEATFPEPAPTKRVLSLKELVAQYWEHAQTENRWTRKSEGENREHIDLLYERFGEDMDISTFGAHEAREMRSVLQKYPVNRNKKKETRGRSLNEVLADTAVKKLSPLTMNKYMNTYSGLFAWAVRERLCELNPFEGLLFSTKKLNSVPPRLPFDDDGIQTIIDTLVTSSEYTLHHKWGSLIAIFTGARLNEVAQLYIEDVYQREGIWCFDINCKPGTNKRLKNSSSKRIVPIHPKLIEYGFLEYLEAKRAGGVERLFPEFSYSESDGYGRNLGRWVNATLLPKLGMKKREHTFHSFRHTMVRKLNAANVSQAHVMAIVGHEPGTTTLNTYNRNGFPPSLLLIELGKAYSG